jgi:V8-like Glu-specific endopeptidase
MMMTPKLSRLTGSITLLLSFLFVSGAVARAQDTVSSLDSDQQRQVAPVRPWTREEMLSAKPYPLAERKGSPEKAVVIQPTGKPEFGPSGRGGDAPLKDALLGTEATAEPAAIAAAYTYPFPYSRYENLAADYTAYPYRTIGKVFFKKGTENFVCSASSIGNYSVLTAGHCVSDGLGHFHTNWVFVPAYNAGAAPYGQWSANFLVVSSAWHNGGGSLWSDDFGGAVLNKVAGLKISQKVGWLGWAVNLPVDKQHWHSIGYPATAPFNGAKQIVCAASWATNDGTNRFGIGCDATGGTSGGPLIRLLRPGFIGANNYVNGLNSYKYTTSQPQALYSPYFGNNAKSHIACLLNSGPGSFKCTGPPVP